MENHFINRDITVFYKQAESFPEGVGGAYKSLQTLLPAGTPRTLYGISFSNGKSGIIYRAAVEESFPGEGRQLDCPTFLIKKGNYAGEELKDWKKDETIIGRTFQKLLKQPNLDPKGYCLEIYENEKDVLCLVLLAG